MQCSDLAAISARIYRDTSTGSDSQLRMHGQQVVCLQAEVAAAGVVEGLGGADVALEEGRRALVAGLVAFLAWYGLAFWVVQISDYLH